ncbi:hypothetical protein EV2_021982 [Malus domestica]
MMMGLLQILVETACIADIRAFKEETMEKVKNKREVKASNSLRLRHRFHGNLGVSWEFGRGFSRTVLC